MIKSTPKLLQVGALSFALVSLANVLWEIAPDAITPDAIGPAWSRHILNILSTLLAGVFSFTAFLFALYYRASFK